MRYVENGWTVAPLAVPRDGVCLCVRGDCVDPHLAGPVVRSVAQAEAIWSEHPWDIALITDSYDVIDVPPQYGALLNQLLKATCPTAMASFRKRWWFFVAPDSIPAAQVAAADGVLHTGPADWIPAPDTFTESTGRTRWLVHPHLTRWRPYQRHDVIDLVFSNRERLPAGPVG
ncbi:hypothetical protein F1D05_18840 [Kribbella qitaiheensis]|uniref:DNA primase/polymerase bifunctional N-terminal domain-containing protein n=1 Tax=Kribbella qitaiheensis TaxID=1544730 RepID=A0A7G6X9T8_9ACTN|nr:hypothetical protein F1D05_18840 [Kribbella qitaiheensis]